MLTTPQREDILQQARETVYEDAQQNWDYLKSIVDAYLDGLSYEDRVNAVCNDEDMWPDVFPFHPLTGEPWPEDDED